MLSRDVFFEPIRYGICDGAERATVGAKLSNCMNYDYHNILPNFPSLLNLSHLVSRFPACDPTNPMGKTDSQSLPLRPH